MANSTRTTYNEAEVNAGMQNGFVQFMQQNRGKDPRAILQEMMASGRISQDHLNMAQAMAKRFEQQFGGLRGMFQF